MHELSIALSILDVVEEEVDRRGDVRVEAIHLKLGPLSGVVKEALLSAFELASEETDFARCTLVIEDVQISIHCPHCNAERPVRSMQSFCCIDCGTPASEVVHGRELQVCALELVE
jgi:hydrogenase nickel incorporation protein HypA/HybF